MEIQKQVILGLFGGKNVSLWYYSKIHYYFLIKIYPQRFLSLQNPKIIDKKIFRKAANLIKILHFLKIEIFTLFNPYFIRFLAFRWNSIHFFYWFLNKIVSFSIVQSVIYIFRRIVGYLDKFLNQKQLLNSKFYKNYSC